MRATTDPTDFSRSTLLLGLFLATGAGVSGCLAAPHAVSGVIPEAWPTDNPAPVAVPVHESWLPLLNEKQSIRIALRVDGRASRPETVAQYDPPAAGNGERGRLWFMFQAEPEDRGRAITFRPVSAMEAESPYRSTYNPPRLEIRTIGDDLILGYHHGEPVMERGYPLNDFIHPLIGLDGEVLTARSPGDHIHHRAIFWAWVRHEIDGKPIGDWWQPKNIHAEARDLAFHDGTIFSTFRARHDWIHTPDGGDQETPFVAEHVICRVFPTTPQGRAVDVDLVLRGLVPNVRIGGTLSLNKGYGGMTIRFGAADGALVESDGGVIKAQNLNQLRASWVDWTGHFHDAEGKPAERRSGAALFAGADHPDHPPEWITRYYGPINVSWPGMDMVELPTDKPVRLYYRIWIHRGDARGGHVEKHYQAYVADWRWPTRVSRTSKVE